tara:strand:- start:2064 stop:2174 length:111 start_codon:yes stop_codon:yes gene_type:complete
MNRLEKENTNKLLGNKFGRKAQPHAKAHARRMEKME